MLRGWERGFLKFSLDLLGLVLSFLAALRFYQPVATWIQIQFGIAAPFNKPLAFLLIASAVSLGLALMAGALLHWLSPLVRHNPMNRRLGLLPGAFNGLLIAAILLTLAVTLPLSRGLAASVQQSGLGSALVAAVTAVEGRLRPVFGEAIAELLTFQTISSEAGIRLDLPFTVANPMPDPLVEEQMLRLVNEERTARGLAPPVMDEGLRAVARAHARDMFERGYFSHFTPEGLSPFDRMRAAGIRFLAAGENLALAPTVEVGTHRPDEQPRLPAQHPLPALSPCGDWRARWWPARDHVCPGVHRLESWAPGSCSGCAVAEVGRLWLVLFAVRGTPLSGSGG